MFQLYTSLNSKPVPSLFSLSPRPLRGRVRSKRQEHGQTNGHRAVETILVARAHGAAALLLDDHLMEIGEPRIDGKTLHVWYVYCMLGCWDMLGWFVKGTM